VCDQYDVAEYRDMVTIVRDRVRDLKKAGMTLTQVKATSPARGYAARYGSTSGPWTTDNFIDAVYKSVDKS
jgi:methionine synthase II (cobalamin-independent)